VEHLLIRLEVKKRLHGTSGDFILEAELEVKEEDFLVVFGPSGSGKTTLLRMIAGLEKPDEGYIEVKGKVWFDAKRGINLPPQKRDVGFVFQDYALFPNMSVFENIAFGMKKKDKDKIMELLRTAGMENLANRKPASLSGGQKQRVALLRAMAREPSILLLDEPLSALDHQTAQVFREEIKNFHKNYRITTIMVSHNKEDAFKLANRVMYLLEGKVLAEGTPKEVFFSRRSSPKFSLNALLLEKNYTDVVCVLTLAIGAELVQVVVDKDTADDLSVGDTLLVSTKAFVPVVRKIHSPHLKT
jgi:molybdate transport system ATP-binding protein